MALAPSILYTGEATEETDPREDAVATDSRLPPTVLDLGAVRVSDLVVPLAVAARDGRGLVNVVVVPDALAEAAGLGRMLEAAEGGRAEAWAEVDARLALDDPGGATLARLMGEGCLDCPSQSLRDELDSRHTED